MEHSRQIVGNQGLFYTAYALSVRGWNVLITSRNAEGIDILIYSNQLKRKYAVQVKTVSERNAAPFSRNLNAALLAEYTIVYRNPRSEKPELHICTNVDIKPLVHTDSDGSNWLEYKTYENYKDAWRELENGCDPL